MTCSATLVSPRGSLLGTFVCKHQITSQKNLDPSCACAHLVLTAIIADGWETSAVIACDLHLKKQKKFPAGCDKRLNVKHNQRGQTYCIILFRKPTTFNSGWQKLVPVQCSLRNTSCCPDCENLFSQNVLFAHPSHQQWVWMLTYIANFARSGHSGVKTDTQ